VREQIRRRKRENTVHTVRNLRKTLKRKAGERLKRKRNERKMEKEV
jgi:hypothetical protein